MSDTNPISLSQDLKKVLQRYLSTALPISTEYPLLANEFQRTLDKQELVIGPFLESLPDFEKGVTLDALTRSRGGFLNDSMSLVPHASTRQLHRHQQTALELACKGDESILVSTGTGSGKTESFLYPILAKLLDDPNLKTPGVTAVLVYPMNALANDQLYYRIAPLLCGALNKFGITFGRYTGQIRAKTKRAEEEDRLLNNPKLMEALEYPKSIPANWLLTREEMLATPPKVLITNYAMLEHILLLPRNAGLMRGANLKFIVLDEIHTYHGAQATEVAYLIRKLKSRLGVDYPLQVFGTSASLPPGDDAEKGLLEFATALFGENVTSIIRGKRLPHRALEDGKNSEFSLSPADWIGLGNCLDKFLTYEVEFQNAEVWNLLVEDLKDTFPINLDCPNEKSILEWLAEIFSSSTELKRVSEELSNGGVLSFEALANKLFAEFSTSAEDRYSALSSVVRVGMVAKSKDSDFPLLPCRYHFAVNSIDGLCIIPDSNSEGWSRLKVARNFTDDHGIYFPLLTCRKCGQPFFEAFASANRLFNQRQILNDGFPRRMVFWMGPPKDALLDEDDELSGETANSGTKLILNTHTGTILTAEEAQLTDTSHKAEIYPVPTEHDEEEKAHYLKKCPRCSGRSLSSETEVVTPMYPGNEALASVVTQRVLEALPAKPVNHYDPLPGEGRNLLAFSDNRQDAAFFAPYFERTSSGVALRSAICNVLLERDGLADSRKLAELVFNFWNQDGKKAVLLDHYGDLVTDKDEVVQLILEGLGEEFMTPGGRRTSSEALGLVSVTYDESKLRLINSKFSKVWSEKYQLNSSETNALIHFLLDSIRREKAIANFYDVDLRSETVWGVYSQHRTFDLEAGDTSVSYKWLASPSRQNRRSYFLERRLGLTSVECGSLLTEFWDTIRNPAVGFLVRHTPGFALDAKSIRFRSGLGQKLYVCNSCGLKQPHCIKSKCTVFRCEGNLRIIEDGERTEFERHNHYVASYKERNHATLRAKEHTASLSTELRENIERDFAQRKINLLSCTTTMEMGVDLGDLEAVVNLNVPPNIANYQQRTGRAGRRAQAAPFCVTIARNTNYDQIVVRDFQQYLKDSPAVPFIHLSNAELFKRHQYSIILSYFLRDRIVDASVNSPELTHLFGSLLDISGCKQKSDEELKAHLDAEIQKFSEALRGWLVSESGNSALTSAQMLSDKLPIDVRRIALNLNELRRDFLEALETFAFEVRGRFEQYGVLINRAARDGKYREAGYWEGVAKDYCAQRLIEQFSRRGLIPTYSFPIHSLTLEITKQENKSSVLNADVVLSRDASLGISEYAPGAEVVANGRIWTSAGLATYPKQFMPERYYIACQDCFHVSIAETKDDLATACENCGSVEGRKAERFIEPRGFVTNYSERRGKDPGRNRRRVRPAEEAKLIASPTDDQFEQTELGYISTVFLSARPSEEQALKGSLFIANKGPYGFGYMRCSYCNYCEPIHARMLNAEPVKRKQSAVGQPNSVAPKKYVHSEPLSGEKCKFEGLNPRFGIDLVHQFETDVRIFRFNGKMPESTLPEIDTRRYRDRLARTISEAFRLAVTQVMDLHAGEVKAIYRLVGDGVAGFDLILHDSVPGGAGYCQNLGLPRYPLSTVIRATIDRLNCPKQCEKGCRSCLLDYSNQRVWDNLDRKAALEWFESLEKPAVQQHGSFQPWPSATLEAMLRRAEPYDHLSLTSRLLIGFPASSELTHAHEDNVLESLRLLVDWLNRGKSLSLYLAGKLERNPKSRLYLTVYRQLSPFVEDGRLKIFELDKDVSKQWMLLPRGFCSSELDAPLFEDKSHTLHLLDCVVGATPRIGKVDETYSEIIQLIQKGCNPLPNDCMKEGEALKMWNLKPYQARNINDIFSDIKGAYIKELIVRDPYCATHQHIQGTRNFLKALQAIAQEVLNIRIYCKEIRAKDGTSEPSYQIEPRVTQYMVAAGFANVTCRATVERHQVRAFHDREVEILATGEDGIDYRLKYYLTGGLDYLMDSDSATKVFLQRI